jgi:pimeloyl-ACP methyl ester carboxylesterase
VRQHEQIQVPVLITHGAQDDIVPITGSREAAKLFRQSQLHIIDSCEHAPLEECPEVSAQIINEFLLTDHLY